MKFVGKKRTIPVSEDYVQLDNLGEFWSEMQSQFPNESLYGLGTNWSQSEFDYYIGKIDEDWQAGSETVELPDDDWHVYSCKDNDKDIEKMYRSIYEQGSLDYEIEFMKDGVFTTRVHYKNSKGAVV